MKLRLSGQTLSVLLLAIVAGGAAVLSLNPNSITRQAQQTAPGAVATASAPAMATHQPDRAGQSRIGSAYGKLPLSFEANQGQSDPQVRFLSRGPGYSLFLTPGEAVLILRGPQASAPAVAETAGGQRAQALRSHDRTNPPAGGASAIVRMQLVGANLAPALAGAKPLPGQSNYLQGSDPAQWHTRIPHYAEVRYEAVYPGIDLLYHGNQRQLEYDFIVAPGANPAAIRFAMQGADTLDINIKGDLVLHTPAGDLVQHKPLIYQDIGGQRKLIDGAYQVATPVAGSEPSAHARELSFQIAAYDASQPLVIDPVLSYSFTLSAGTVADDAVSSLAIAIDTTGNAYVTGFTNLLAFPTTAGAFDPSCGPGDSCGSATNAALRTTDAFVSKLNAAGTALLYSTYLGGGRDDRGTAIAVDSTGNAYIGGSTRSVNFPVLNAFQAASASLDGSEDGFVSKLNAAGTALVYSTYLGGSGADSVTGIFLDTNNSAYLTGTTASTNFPLAHAMQPAAGGGSFTDAFVSKLNPAGGALVYSTYFGGSSTDEGHGIAVDSGGRACLTGRTSSVNFPVRNALQPTLNTLNNSIDAFVSCLNPAGSGLTYSTFLGGSGVDNGLAIAVNAAHQVFVSGETSSDNFPVANAFQLEIFNPGNFDGFVARLNTDAAGAASRIYSSYLGGLFDDSGTAIALDAADNVYVSGHAGHSSFPQVNSVPGAANAQGFLAKISSSGLSLYSTRLDPSITGVAVDSARNVYVTGNRASSGAAPATSSVIISKVSELQRLEFSSAVFEADELQGNAVISVAREGGGVGAVSVQYATGSVQVPSNPNYRPATINSDYTPASGTLTWADGDVQPKSFTVRITRDNVLEAVPEELGLTLSVPGGGIALGTSSAALVIHENELFTSGSTEPAENVGSVSIAVFRSGFSSAISPISVNFATQDGTAIAGVDYVATSGTLTLAPGERSRSIPVTIIDDSVAELGPKAFTVKFSNPVNAVFTPNSGSTPVFIYDNDPYLRLVAGPYSLPEGNGNARIRVVASNRQGFPQPPIQFTFTTSDISAIAGADYTPVSRSFTIPANGKEIAVEIPVLQDAVAEANEALRFTISNVIGAELFSPSTETLTILDDDGPGQLHFASASAIGNEGAGLALVQVVRTGSIGRAISVDYASGGGTATAGSDFTAVSGRLDIPAGVNSGFFTVPVLNDTLVEANETVSLTLSNPVGATLIAPASTTLFIHDNEPSQIRFSGPNYSSAESSGNATITVYRLGNNAAAASVNYATANLSALAGSDYTDSHGILNFAAGQAVATFTVPVIDDSVSEGGERVRLTLSNPAGAILSAPASADLIISDNDASQTRFMQADVTVNETSGSAVITVLRTGSLAAPATVSYASQNGTATNADYTPVNGILNFAAGQNSASFSVAIVNDTLPEPVETVNIGLSNPSGTSLGTPAAVNLGIISDE